MLVLLWRQAITEADDSASISTIPPGYNRNLTEFQAWFRVVDNLGSGKLDYFAMKTSVALLILIASLAVASGQVRKPAPKVGDKAPDFSLPNPDGKTVSLTDYTARGPVVLIFYRGYW
jgi:hypothetical protein